MPIWYYDKRTLRATPTALSGIDMETEHRYRREGARFIINTGTKLGLHYDTIATGVVYFHRFYMFHSFKDFPRYVTACCCLFLAGKVEETPKKCKDVIKTARSLLTDQQFIQFGEDPREEIMVLERILLKVIKFDLQVEHPYSYLLKYAKCLKGDRVKLQKMVQSAWTFVNDSLCTTLCLQWEPEIIAIALMYLAGKLSKFEVTDWAGKHSRQRRWWEVYVEDITVELLEDICHQVLDLYSSPPSKVESPPASPPSKTPMRASTSSLVLEGFQSLHISSNGSHGIRPPNPVQTNSFTLPVVVTERNTFQPIGGQQIPSIGFQQAMPTIKLAKMESQPTTPKSALLTPTELGVQSMPMLGDGSSLSRNQSPHPQLQPKHHLVDDLQAFLTSGIPLPPSSTGYGANTYLTPGNGEAMSHNHQQYMERAAAHQQQGQMSSGNPLYKTTSMQSSSQAVYETQSYQGSFATPPPPPPPSNQYYHQHQHPGMRSASYQASHHPPQMQPFSQDHQQQHLVQSNQMAYGHLPPPPPPPPMMGNPQNVNYSMGYPGGIVIRQPPPPPPPSGQRRQW